MTMEHHYGMKTPKAQQVNTDQTHERKCSKSMEIVNNHRYPVVCLCGSTRFRDAFDDAAAKLSLKGYVVLSLGVFDKSGDTERYDIDETDENLMSMLSDMHKQRIEMSDSIFVVNVDGYVGDATKGEIDYARSLGKEIMWLEEVSVGEMDVNDKGEIVYFEVV